MPAFSAFLRKRLGKDDVPAFFAPLFSARQGRELTELFRENCASFRTDLDLVDRVWTERPPRSASGIWVHPEEYAGEGAWWKIARLREAFQKEGCTCFFTGALDETAWILNLRGGDIACNPVFLSYLLLKEDIFLNKFSSKKLQYF